jgi:tetratricopeptide (TPR) repeat protein
MVAHITGHAGWRDQARKVAEDWLSRSEGSLFEVLGRLATALVVADEGAAPEARTSLAALEASAFQLEVSRWEGFYRSTYVCGIVAHAAGELDKATSYFEQEIATDRRGDYRSNLAWACCDYADLLLDRKAPGDEERAMALLDESLELSRDLGMVPLMERVLSRRKILKA